MTNFEKLAQSPTELTKLIYYVSAYSCGGDYKFCTHDPMKCKDKNCFYGISKWLEQEVESEDKHDDNNG